LSPSTFTRWKLIRSVPSLHEERPGISACGSPLVDNAKMLHFLLPGLVPPIDRTYTGRFFYGLHKGDASERGWLLR
jgi:hypothetical protein